ncbi:MarR family transcriptional regulator [Streptomyces sp. NPDC003635]
MTTTAPAVDSRVIGLAHYAARAVLESVLAGYGLTFQEQITLRLVVVAEAPVTREAIVEQVVGSLKVDADSARSVIAGLTEKGLLEDDGASDLRVTDAAAALFAESGAEISKVAARIYAGIPAEDLAAAGRVLTLVTERANAELAARAA